MSAVHVCIVFSPELCDLSLLPALDCTKYSTLPYADRFGLVLPHGTQHVTLLGFISFNIKAEFVIS